MTVVHALVWLCLALGCALSFVAGKRANSWVGTFGMAAGLSAVLFVLLNFALAGCAEARICPHLGDAGLTYALSPIFGFPIFWLVAGVSSNRKRAPNGKNS